MLALFYNRPFHFSHFFTFLYTPTPLKFSLSTFLPFFSRLFTVLCSACKLTFYDIFGKGAAFTGTLLVSVVTQLTGHSRYGIISISFLFVIGFVLFVIAVRRINHEKSSGTHAGL